MMGLRFALEPLLTLGGILASTPIEFVEHVFLTAAILLLKFSGIPRFAVDLDQPAVRVVRLEARIDLEDLHRAGRERAELSEVDLCLTLQKGVLAEQLPIGLQVRPRLGEKGLGVGERTFLRGGLPDGHAEQHRDRQSDELAGDPHNAIFPWVSPADYPS